MRTLLLALCLLLPLAPAHAQQRLYSQPELDALLAPVALYPDPLLSQILAAAVYPDQVAQALRQRAQASGYLRSDGEQQVYQQGPAIAVQPVYPQYMYVRYYDPLVVYGPWWWPAYRPVFWRPWAPRVVFVNHVNIVSRPV